MAKYLFVYHGGKKPEDPATFEKVMQAWGEWAGSMGDAVIDGGNPVGLSTTVNSDKSVTNNGGSNPVSGYGIFIANNVEDAIAKAKKCPILDSEGNVELAEIIEM